MRTLAFAALAVCLTAAAAARADTLTFSFGTATSLYSGSGTLSTGAVLAPGEYTVASLIGSVTAPGRPAVAISSILNAGTFPTPLNGGTFPANDNVVFFSNGVGTFSQDGVSFALTDGTQVNLFNGGIYPDVFVLPNAGPGVYETTPITISGAAAVTPEPAPFLLLATGVGAAFLLRKTI